MNIFKKQQLFTLFLSLLCWKYSKSQHADSIVLHNAVLYYYSYGTGEPIVILSGGPGIASHQEDDVAIELSKHYKAILFDQRGTGKSWTKPPDNSTINLKTATEDLETLRKHLRIDKLICTGTPGAACLPPLILPAFLNMLTCLFPLVAEK